MFVKLLNLDLNSFLKKRKKIILTYWKFQPRLENPVTLLNHRFNSSYHIMLGRIKLKTRQTFYQENGTMLDRISDLPECLLIHILSSLPTKTQWPLAFYLAGGSYFGLSSQSSTLPEKHSTLSAIVCILCPEFLINTKHHISRLQTFRFTYNFCPCCSSLVRTWINNVASRIVEELDRSWYLPS